MNKTPLIAIIISIVAVVGIYFFMDIKPSKNNTTKTNVNQEIVENQEIISAFNKTLAPEIQQNLNRWLANAEDNKDTLALDSLINQYESLQQYNFSAYYHTLKAEIQNTKESWALAGDRQYKVSQNTAYDSTFNHILLDKSIDSYNKAIEFDKTDLDLKTKLGEAYMMNAEQPMQGITILLDVVKQDSMNINANLALGKFGIVSGQYDKALNRLEKVLSLQPENKEALLLAAEAATNIGDLPYAIDKLERSKELIEDEAFKKDIDLLIEQLKK